MEGFRRPLRCLWFPQGATRRRKKAFVPVTAPTCKFIAALAGMKFERVCHCLRSGLVSTKFVGPAVSLVMPKTQLLLTMERPVGSGGAAVSARNLKLDANVGRICDSANPGQVKTAGGLPCALARYCDVPVVGLAGVGLGEFA
jgi:hypothetical protein